MTTDVQPQSFPWTPILGFFLPFFICVVPAIIFCTYANLAPVFSNTFGTLETVRVDLESDPRIVEALGEPIQFSRFEGSLNTNSRNGITTVSYIGRVVGPKGGAKIETVYTQIEDQIVYQALQVRTDDGVVIDLLNGEDG